MVGMRAGSVSGDRSAKKTPPMNSERSCERDLQCEPGLAGPARPGERQQARVPDEIGNVLHFLLATDEVGHLGGEVRGDLERARGRELLRQSRDCQLE